MHRCAFVALAAAGLVPASSVVASGVSMLQDAALANAIGATHWSPCYYIDSTVPSLYDGANTLGPRMQTSAIKLVLQDDPPYLWNTFGPGKHGHWNLTGTSTLAQLAAHPWYTAVFNNSLGTAYSTYILVTYRFGTGGYFCAPPVTDDNVTAEVNEFEGLTSYLMNTYQGMGKRFIYQHWEGDWASRCGGYNASQPAQPAVQAAMVRWLAGRQTGTSNGRQQFCRDKKEAARAAAATGETSGSIWLTIDCSDERSILAAAGVEVYHASEVNLVASSMSNGFPNNILNVIPKVQLDMVSYSSYDTQATPQFGQALDFIASHHNATSASPTPAVYVGEYGLAQQTVTVDALHALLDNVIGFGLSPSPVYNSPAYRAARGQAGAVGTAGGLAGASSSVAAAVPRAAHMQFWELFDNENTCSPDQRCNSAPCFNTTCLRGFWLVRPNNTDSFAMGYLRGIINGTVPVPQPPAEDEPHRMAALKEAHEINAEPRPRWGGAYHVRGY